MHKKVLLITACFPPVGGGGVIRALKMAKYLGEFGCDLWVLTRGPRPNDIADPSLLTEVPSSVRVIRSRDVDPYRWLYLFRFRSQAGARGQAAGANPSLPRKALAAALRRLKAPALKLLQYTAIPDEFYWWARAALSLGEKIIREERIDVLFSTAPPHSAHLLACALKERTGALWIADFRDPWTQNIHKSGIPWRERREEKMEQRVLSCADAVTTVTPSFAEGFRAKYGKLIKRLEVIYNGFDPADFADISPLRRNDRFTAVHTGLLYEKRSPRALLEAVGELVAEGKVGRDEICLFFAGRSSSATHAEISDLVCRFELDGAVEMAGELPHREALAVLMGADVLLLIGDAAPEAGAYIPGKLFEYMAAGRPVLALTVPGEAERLITRHRLGRVVHPLDKEGIKKVYLEMYRAWREGRLPTQAGVPATLRIYDRRYQAGQLAELLDELLAARKSGTPGL